MNCNYNDVPTILLYNIDEITRCLVASGVYSRVPQVVSAKCVLAEDGHGPATSIGEADLATGVIGAVAFTLAAYVVGDLKERKRG